jgi:hypothetical protein
MVQVKTPITPFMPACLAFLFNSQDPLAVSVPLGLFVPPLFYIRTFSRARTVSALW